MRYTARQRAAVKVMPGPNEPPMSMAEFAVALDRSAGTATSTAQALKIAGAIEYRPYHGVRQTAQGLAWLEDDADTVTLCGHSGMPHVWTVIQLSRKLRLNPQTSVEEATRVAKSLGLVKIGSGVQCVAYKLEMPDGQTVVVKPLTRCFMGQGEHFGNRLPRGIDDIPGCRTPFMIVCGTWVIQEYVEILGRMASVSEHTRLETLRVKAADVFIGYDLHSMNCGRGWDGMLVFIDA